jgi:chromosome segregation ATPase
LAEERCRAAETLNAELKEDLSFFEKAKQVFKGTEAELASRLEVSLGTLRQSESKWQAESGERQRLGKALQEAQTLVRDKQQAIEKQELELQTTVKALNETQSKFQKEASERQHLAEALNAARRNLDDQAQRSEKLESQLRTVLEALTETKSVLQSESSERQRLAEALEAAHREQREQSQRSEIEVSKLRSQIHLEGVERKRLEADVAQLRHQATDSERAGRILQSTLRKQIRKPVDDVYQSARCLLQLELPEEQKKLVEVVLKDALLVQTCLQEDEPLFNGSNS